MDFSRKLLLVLLVVDELGGQEKGKIGHSESAHGRYLRHTHLVPSQICQRGFTAVLGPWSIITWINMLI